MKCILSDYAGVISLPQDNQAIHDMAQICGLPVKDFEKAYWVHREVYDQGKLSGPEYWKKSFNNSAFNPENIETLIKRDCESWTLLNKETLKWFEELKEAGFRMALFSNMPPELTQYLKINIPWLKIFEESYYSCEIGLSKPHPESFKKVLAELRLSPSEVIFIDDREDNIGGAMQVGLKAIHFKNAFDARSEFQKLISRGQL